MWPSATHFLLHQVRFLDSLSAGGVCCWRPSESRQSKTLSRTLSDRRMTLVVDDSIDVWAEDLPNLCLTRRFVGDQLDDGLQQLSWQLGLAHRTFYSEPPSEGFSYESSMAHAPPSVPGVLSDTRGQLLAGCTIALTGVVTDQREDHAEFQPLCVLIRLYGGEYTLNVDAATHLVARRKDGWQRSPKINRALNRLQVCNADRTSACERPQHVCTQKLQWPLGHSSRAEHVLDLDVTVQFLFCCESVKPHCHSLVRICVCGQMMHHICLVKYLCLRIQRRRRKS